MSFIKRFFAFWYDFIVGDDWVVAAGVIVTVVIAGTLARANLQTVAGGAISVGVLLVLVLSLWRATLAERSASR